MSMKRERERNEEKEKILSCLLYRVSMLYVAVYTIRDHDFAIYSFTITN